MKLAIFDIDGTLVRSGPYEDGLFWQALGSVLGIRREVFDWSLFPHVTDSGIAGEVHRRQFGRDPAEADLAATEEHFAELWNQALAALPRHQVEVPGAKAILEHLSGSADWRIAVATGGWGRSARVKLDAAGIDHAGIGFGCANDSIAREKIIAVAERRARALCGTGAFERVVYVGDGAWDVKTCRGLGMPLVGVASQSNSALEGRGVSHVLRDYRDPGAVIAALETALVPRSSDAPV